MFGIVEVTRKPPRPAVVDRLWLIFFRESEYPAWWVWMLLKPGFRHVMAACWYDDAQRWVLFNPTRHGTTIELFESEEFGGRFGYLLKTSSVVLRMRSRLTDRQTTSAWFFCVGAVKALLGIRSRALSPRALMMDLVARGAEIVEAPDAPEVPIGSPVQDPGDSAAGPGGSGHARVRGGACEALPHRSHPGTITTRNAA
ncbi:MAG: hypothetical protein Q7R45_07280 [Sulfuricaulis sp.]|nr:hypothetical protein [Sulfuricaulis sp.]